MTGSEYWIITGFGFLFAMRPVRRMAGEKRTGLSLHGLWRGSLDLLVCVVLLVTLYDLGAKWGRTSPWLKEYGFLILWLAAYLLGKHQKKPDIFFISSATLAFWLATSGRGDWAVQVSLAAVMISGIFIFQMFFQGLKYAARFARVPPQVQGWPAFCLFAFFITVTLSVIAGLIF